MDIAKTLQEKLNEVYDDNILEDGALKKAKAHLAAFTNGAIDGMLVTWPFMYATLVALLIKKHNKK